MRIVSTIIACFVVVLCLGASMTCAEIIYEGSWHASALPEASIPVFEFRGDAGYAALVTTGTDAPYLNISTPATFGSKTTPGAYNDYTLNNNASIDMSAGGTVDFTMRINGRSSPADSNAEVNAFLVYAPNGSGGCYVYAAWAKVGAIAGYSLDTSVWHDYRLQLENPGDAAALIVDGIEVGSISGSLVASLDYNGIRFGDVSDSRSGDADWKFVGWNPVPEPSMLGLLCATGLFVLLARRK